MDFIPLAIWDIGFLIMYTFDMYVHLKGGWSIDQYKDAYVKLAGIIYVFGTLVFFGLGYVK